MTSHRSPADTASPALSTLLQCSAEVLRTTVRGTDHFLDLGGTSLAAVRLVALLAEHDLELKAEDLFAQDDMVALSRCLVPVAAPR